MAKQAFTGWRLYSQRDKADGSTYTVYGTAGPAVPKPMVPPKGGRGFLSTDRCWYEVHDAKGDVVAVYSRLPIR